jgi:hypothetical protein
MAAWEGFLRRVPVAPVAHAAKTLTLLSVAVSAVATLAFAVGLLAVRPMMYGEAEMVFEASRIRAHLPLFVDPLVGSYEYGPVPTRYQVPYPPLWSWALSHAPGAWTMVIGRAVATLAWLGALAWVASRARPELRRQAWLAAAVVAGVFVVALFPTTARPDAVAVALAGAALARAVRRGQVDATTGAMLALAAWTKPNVLGIAAGVLLFALVHRRRDLVRAALGGLAVSVPVAVGLHVVSHGVWVQQLVRALGQPLTLEIWWKHVWTRAMFVAPVAYVTWIAARAARAKDDPGARLAGLAWATSLAWTLLSLAKIGSASNYWMEPAMAAVVVAGVAPPPALGAAGRAVLWVGALAASLWLTIATVGGVTEAFVREPRRAALLARARADCGARPDELVVADNPGSEMVLDGRLVVPAMPTVYLVKQGHMPVSTWVHDLEAPEIACVLEQEGLFHALPEIGDVIDRRFVAVETVEDWRLYRLRER